MLGLAELHNSDGKWYLYFSLELRPWVLEGGANVSAQSSLSVPGLLIILSRSTRTPAHPFSSPRTGGPSSPLRTVGMPNEIQDRWHRAQP